MIIPEHIRSLVLKKIKGTGIFLVDVNVGPGNTILVHLDTPEGISISECADVNHYLNEVISRDIEDYDLVVSSPGLGSPLKVKEQYSKNLGKDIEVILKNGNKLIGKLLDYTGQELVIEVLKKDILDKKKKRLISEKIILECSTIKSTKSIISFK